MDNQFFLFIMIAIAIVVVVVVMDQYGKQRRTKDMRAVAERLGYDFVEEEAGLANLLGEFALISQRGRSRKTTNLLHTVMDEAAITAFDYRYTVGYGKNRHTVSQSVLLLESQRLDLPAFTLRPEGLGQKLQSLLGQQDIDFEDHPDFSAAYLLQGPDESQVRALFDGEKLGFFAQRRGLCIEGHGQKLLYYRPQRRVSPEAIPAFMEEGLGVLDLLAGREASPPAEESDYLAGLDEVLAEIG